MNRLNRTAAALALGFACAMPAMAQTSGTAASSSQQPAQTAQQSAPDTRAMGAGPADEGRMESRDTDRDLGWIGLLGLLGLLGMRKRHSDDHNNPNRADNNRRANTY